MQNEERNDIKPNEVVEIYNNCKKEFKYDTNLEIFYFDGTISENDYLYYYETGLSKTSCNLDLLLKDGG